MQLAVDIGNSYSKAALYKEEQLLEFVYFNEQQPYTLSAIFEKYGNPSQGMIASVRNISPEFLTFLHSVCPIKILDHTTSLPFKITYSTPQTLGRDRIAAVAAAFGRYPGKNVLVIDMGTCITYDILQADRLYPGGSISPGITMRLKAMHHFTDKLPLAEVDGSASLTGRDTLSALQSGAVWGVQKEIEGIIDAYSSIYEELTVLIGGGDNKYFDKKFRISIFAASNLVIEGLKIIMDYNEIG